MHILSSLHAKFSKRGIQTYSKIFHDIRNYPPHLLYAMIRIVARLFIGKSKRNKYLHLHPSDFVFSSYVKRTDDDFLFYIRKEGNEIGLCELFHEPEVRKIFQPKSDEIVIDIGAHVGTYTIRLAKRAKYVVAIEPHSSIFQVLRHNIKLNKLDNVLALNVGVGMQDSIMYLCPSYDCGGRTQYGLTKLTTTEGRWPVKVYSLDSLTEKLRLQRIDWIKIDAEGMEFDILQGARNTLKKYEPKMIIEIHGDDRPHILKFLSDNRYSFEDVNTNHIFAQTQSQLAHALLNPDL